MSDDRQADLNPYSAPKEQSAAPVIHRGAASPQSRLLTNTAFALALAGPPIAFVCGLSGINLGFWDQLARIVTGPIALLLYLATTSLAPILGFASLVAAVVCLIDGTWRQRAIVIAVLIAYPSLVLFGLPLLNL